MQKFTKINMIYADPKTEYSILDLGFDKFLTKTLPGPQGLPTTPEMSNVFTSGVAAKSLLPGELLEFIDTGKAGISGLGDLSTDIRIWAGETFANRASAPFRVAQDGSTTLSRLDFGRHTWILPFESVDGYTLTLPGGGAAITPKIMALEITESGTANAVTRIHVGEVYNIIPATIKNPSIQFSMKLNDPDDRTTYVLWGDRNPFDASPLKSFGFKTKPEATAKVYGVYRTSPTVEVETELVGVLSTTKHNYRAAISGGGTTIKFYVDGVLYNTVTPGWTNWDSDYLFCIAVKSGNTTENRSGFYWDLVIQQDF